MPTNLIALSLLAITHAAGGQAESVFPKSEVRNSVAMSDKVVFEYLSESTISGAGKYSSVPDWSELKLVIPKPTATKLRVLMLVFERDYTNPAISNTLELTDKTRLIQSMSRIRAFFASMSNGEIDLEVIPRFIPEPILNEYEAKEILEKEYNKSAFDADDREERGPFATICTITGSRDSLSFAQDFTALAGNTADPLLEQNIIRTICNSLRRNVVQRFQELAALNSSNRSPFTSSKPWPTVRAGVDAKLFDPAFRADTQAVLNGTEAFGPRENLTFDTPLSTTTGAVEIGINAGVLTYSEAAIIRNGSVALPGIPTGILEFKVRTKSTNPISFQMVQPTAPGDAGPTIREVQIGAGAQVAITPDGTWQTIRLGTADGKSMHVSFGVPASLSGKTRNPHEVIKYEFKEFRLVSAAPTPLVQQKQWNLKTVEGVSEALNSAPTEIKRLAIREIIGSPEAFKSLQPKLLEMSTELEPAVAHAAVLAYGRLGIANDDLIGKSFMNRLVSTAPNEYAREAALLYFAEHPEQTTFEAIAPNIVRRSWRTRIATVKALAALEKTDLKAKPAARQLLLTACGQDMAIIRSTALAAMRPDVDLDRKQLEYSLVNDPSEQVRLQCLKQLGEANAPKEVLLGALADDSPHVREHVAEQLPVNLRREALQRMVIDRDTYVRAAALYGFAKLVDPTQPGEIQNTFAEEHPAVLLALIEGAQRGKWKLPDATVSNAKKSKSPLVREGIAKLGLT